MNRLEKIHRPGQLTIGLEFPLDNDWSADGDAKRKLDSRPFGVPNISSHARYVKLADELGFKALWMRDVPVYDPGFGDAAQLFEPFTYLGYLSAITHSILLGTAAIVLPLREPILIAKSAASIDLLSNGRLLLGLGLGDRAIEFPLFGYDFENRRQRFRDGVTLLKHVWKKDGTLDKLYKGLNGPIEVFPKPINETIPLVMAGHGQQSIEWIAANMQAWFNYPRDLKESEKLIMEWNDNTDLLQLERKPYITAFHLNLEDNADAPLTPHKFGGSIGRNRFIELITEYQTAGVGHMAIHLRRSRRPADEVMMEIGEYILPVFHQAPEQN